MQRNASDADGTWSRSVWVRLGVSAGLWLYVNAALLIWAYDYPWHLALALAASTAAVVVAACAPASLLPVFAIAAAVLYWASALVIDGERHPGQELLAWSVISLVLVLAAGLTILRGRRLAPASGALPAGGWRPPSGPRRAPDPHQSPDGPSPGPESAPVPAVPLGPAPALRAAAEADPDED